VKDAKIRVRFRFRLAAFLLQVRSNGPVK
jgi:hypothetical protein